MIYCFDLDGTLCTLEVGHDMTEGSKKDKLQYQNAKPIKDRISVVNQLYSEGNTIIIETARGSVSGTDWYEETTKQLDSWGVKYHKLRTGVKHAADLYVDDKAIYANDFFMAMSSVE